MCFFCAYAFRGASRQKQIGSCVLFMQTTKYFNAIQWCGDSDNNIIIHNILRNAIAGLHARHISSSGRPLFNPLDSRAQAYMRANYVVVPDQPLTLLIIVYRPTCSPTRRSRCWNQHCRYGKLFTHCGSTLN